MGGFCRSSMDTFQMQILVTSYVTKVLLTPSSTVDPHDKNNHAMTRFAARQLILALHLPFVDVSQLKVSMATKLSGENKQYQVGRVHSCAHLHQTCRSVFKCIISDTPLVAMGDD